MDSIFRKIDSNFAVERLFRGVDFAMCHFDGPFRLWHAFAATKADLPTRSGGWVNNNRWMFSVRDLVSFPIVSVRCDNSIDSWTRLRESKFCLWKPMHAVQWDIKSPTEINKNNKNHDKIHRSSFEMYHQISNNMQFYPIHLWKKKNNHLSCPSVVLLPILQFPLIIHPRVWCTSKPKKK